MKNSSTRPAHAWTARAVLLLCAFVLAACSAVRFGYNHGESIAWWWLDGYIDASADQKPWIKRRIDAAFAWHRQTQLRDYTQFLAQTQKQVQRPVTKQELEASYAEVRKRMHVMIEHVLPDLADLALALRPGQIARIEEKFASNNDKFRKDYLRGDLAERQAFRFKKVMEQAEYWFGDFSREQEAAIRKASDARLLNNEQWFAGRVHRQREMIALLRKIQAEKPPREQVVAQLRQYADVMIEHAGGGEHEAYFEASKDGALDLALVVMNHTTPAQKAFAVKRLQQWIDNFSTLAGQKG